MDVEVLLFGDAAVRAGSGRVVVLVEGGGAGATTVRGVLAALHEQHPVLGTALPGVEAGRLAVNQEFAWGDHPIRVGDEVALVTLVGGG